MIEALWEEKKESQFLVLFTAAAAAKSLQSCLTLRDPMDCSPPGFSVHGILQARVLEWGAIAFSDMISRIAQNSGWFLSVSL